jgi:phosphomannomutase
VLEVGADIGSRSTATPTACSWSTSRGSACPARPPPRSSPPACSTSKPGAKVLHNLICSKAVPEVVREHGGSPVRTKVGHSFIKQPSWPRPARCSAASTRRTTTSATTSAPTPGLIAAMLVLEQLSLASLPLSELRKPYERYADSGEINTQVPTRRGHRPSRGSGDYVQHRGAPQPRPGPPRRP